jgi:hypothetical protein
MKRTQLIEYGLIVVGIYFAYKFFESIIGALVQVFYDLQTNGDLSNLPSYFFLTALYAVGFILIIRLSKKIAISINGAATDDNIPIKIGKRALLQVILIAICIATVLSNMAEILLYFYEIFKKKAGRGDFYGTDRPAINEIRFKIVAVETIIALVVLYFSKDISGWFIRKDEVDELTFDSTNESK